MTDRPSQSDPAPPSAGPRIRRPSRWPRLPGRLTDPVRALEFRHLGRTLLQSALVGVAVGLVACLFFAALEWGEYLLLGRLAGYIPLRPAGEHGVEIAAWAPRAPTL